jgi:hypothetical protein
MTALICTIGHNATFILHFIPLDIFHLLYVVRVLDGAEFKNKLMGVMVYF